MILHRSLQWLVFLTAAPLLLSQDQSTISFNADDLNGDRIQLSDCLKSGPVYISFWALWCEPCKAELKVLQKFHDEYASQGLTILAVNRDAPKSLAKVKSYVRSQKYAFTVLLDPNDRLFEMLNGTSTPYSVILDRTGAVVRQRSGFLPGDEVEIAEEIESVLRESSK